MLSTNQLGWFLTAGMTMPHVLNFSVKHPSKLPTKFIVSDAIAENILKERLDLDRDRVIVEDNLQFRYFLHKTKRLRKEPAEPAALILGSPLIKGKSAGDG